MLNVHIPLKPFIVLKRKVFDVQFEYSNTMAWLECEIMNS